LCEAADNGAVRGFVEGDKIFVVSTHGSRTATAGRELGRAAIAEALLGEIVDARIRP
jgi:regulator of RNase E activity RraA